MSGFATDHTTTLVEVVLAEGSRVVVWLEEGIEEPQFNAEHFIDGVSHEVVSVVVNREVLTDGVDLGWCEWCEEAESQTYLDHEGHDEECPFA